MYNYKDAIGYYTCGSCYLKTRLLLITKGSHIIKRCGYSKCKLGSARVNSRAMATTRDILCLFDIDGTLTPSRLVSLYS